MSGPVRYVRFGLALLLSAILIYGDLALNALQPLRGYLSFVLLPFRVVADFPGDVYNATYGYFRDRSGLLEEKARLEKIVRENEVSLKSFDYLLRQNDELRTMLNLKERLAVGGKNQWQSAGVLRNFSRQTADKMYLDKGTADGVFPGMSVVDANGVMGQIIRVDAQTSVVNLITNHNQWLAARIVRTGMLVIVRGDGEGKLRVEYAPNSTDFRVGDKLIAAGGALPIGYPIAVIDEVSDSAVYKEAIANPSSNFWNNEIALIYLAGFDAASDGALQ